MKKTLTLSLALGAGLMLVGCKPAPAIESLVKKETIAMQATIALTLVDGFSASPTMQALRKQMIAQPEDPNIPVATLDVLFNNGVNFNIEKKDSDRIDYKYLDVISFNIDSEEKIEYKLYYNIDERTDDLDDDSEEMAPVSESTSTLDHEALARREHEDDDKNENGERNRNRHRGRYYKLRGLAIVGEEEYRFMAKNETDVDDDETETEIRLMLWKKEGNFIHIKQEIEIEGTPGDADYEYEEEFFYMVVENGEVVKQFKLELENEDNELELKVKIDGVKYEVEYDFVDDKVFINIKVNGDRTYTYQKIVITDEETGETTVSYALIH